MPMTKGKPIRFPALTKYQSEKKIFPCPVMEIYNIPKKKIEYVTGSEINNGNVSGPP